MHMTQRITVRLTKVLARWLDETSKRSGIPRDSIIREQLEKARNSSADHSFMRLAGTVRGARDLSTRKGFRAR
jgi:predicted DNA-binding protein